MSAAERILAALPHPKAEDWRWSDLSGAKAALEAAPANDAEPDARPWVIEGCGPAWVFLDGRLVSAPEGMGRLTERRLEVGESEVGHALAAIAAEHARGGVELRLGAGHAPAGPVQVVHFASGGASHLVHRYALEADAQASVIETYVQLGGTPAWANVAVEVELGRGARLMRSVRRFEMAGLATETAQVRVGAAAAYDAVLLQAGEAASRAEHQVRLDGPGAFASVDGAVLARGRANHSVLNVVAHAVPETTSRQTWRAVAGGRATASIAGRVEVARDAQKSDAGQSVRGMLLDRTATINAKPELEIFADDVKAAHGCAIGELDAQALFYLGSRGLPPGVARALLTEAFVGEALELVGEAAAREAFAADARRWLEAL